MVLFACLSFTNGVIIPYYEEIQIRPVIVFDRNPVSMLEHYAEISISEDIAKITVNEVFYNNSDQTVEVMYLFPIPEQSFITDFKLTVNGIVYEGMILEKEEARILYESYVRQQKDPALLEYIDQKMIRIRIFPFAPYETRAVQVEYHHELQKTGDYYKLVYPLKIDTLLKGNIGKVEIRGSIRSSRDVYNVYSPTYNVGYNPQPGEVVTFKYTEEDMFPSDDFVLFIGYGERQYEAYFVNDEEEPGKGTFMLDILPYYLDVGTMKKNVILVLDKSGSMYGRKYEQALNAANYVLERLNQEDQFGVVLFSDTVSEYKRNLLKYIYSTEEAGRAINWLDSSEASGGTNIYGALNRAMITMLSKYAFQNNYVIFLTDGVPTSGITDVNRIAADAIAWAKNTGTKMFIFGVGYDVNTGMLDLLAQESGGMAFYVEENESIETQVSQLFSNVSHPLMTDITVEIAGENAQISDLLPSKNLTIYKDYPLKLFGHYTGEGPIQIRITGKIAGKDGSTIVPFEQVYEVTLGNNDNPYISKLWASRRISELLNHIKLVGETQEDREEIIRLSKKYGIPTPYTSYLVLEGFASYMRDEADKDGTIAPSSTSLGAQPAAPSLKASGQTAFEASKSQNLMVQSQTTRELEEAYASQNVQRNMKNIAGKVFVYFEEEELWVDSEFKEENVIEITTFSDAYFKLINRIPEFKDYLTVGANFKIAIEGVNYYFKE
jgi:Ca-activated chloride channel family protein